MSRKPKVFFLLTTSCVITVSLATLSTRSQETHKNEVVQQYQNEIIKEAPDSTDVSERSRRQNKNRRYDIKGGKPLTELPPGIGLGYVSEVRPLPLLPVEQSDVVMLGTVVKAQPYLTESKTKIYSEFIVSVEEIFKNITSKALAPGDKIVVDQEGGSLQLPNGRVLNFTVGGKGRLPRNNNRYVFFLKHINDGQDLSIVTGFELREGRVLPLDSRIRSPHPYANADEATFLNEIRIAVMQR